MTEAPDKSVPQALETASQAQAAYRFWSNTQVKPEQIIASQLPEVRRQVAASGNVVLAVQDTTDLSYGINREKARGLGFINKSIQQGIKVHSCLAVSPTGMVLGLLDQHYWNRPERSGKRADYKKKPTCQKENQRWLDTMKQAEKSLPSETTVVHMGDREADFYDFFVEAQRLDSHFLIRAVQNRKVRHELDYLVPAIEQSPLLSTRQIQLQRHPNRAARAVSLELRAMTMTLEVPAQHPEAKSFEPIPVNVLLIEEANSRKKKINPKKAIEKNTEVNAVSPSQGHAKTTEGAKDGKQKKEQAHEPIRWLLLTSLPIETPEQAWQIVDWYTYRWTIERFHYVLKQGCSVEDLQLSYKQRLCNAIATYSIVSCRLLGLMETSRQTPEQSCEYLLSRPEWRVLQRKFQPKNRSTKPPTLSQVVVWIAQLGGFMARKGDGLPGVKTLWRGLSKLHDLLEGVQLAPKT